MQGKVHEKAQAIKLRTQGKTYNEILKEVPVAKSTLSLWLRDVGLLKAQTQKITAKKRAAQIRGGKARKDARVHETEQTYKKAASNVGILSQRERLLVGAALYWAEGAKERSTTRSQGIDFGNSDVHMMKFFREWLIDCMGVIPDDMSYSLYIHENSKSRISEVKHWWGSKLGIDPSAISYVYYKTHNPKTKRSNIGDDYYGLLRIRVCRSSSLQRETIEIIYGITGADWRID